MFDDGGDLVETSFLMQGLLAARQYFHGANEKEQSLYRRISQLWETVEWDWYRQTPNSDFLYWHWSPRWAWQIHHPLIGFNEVMITYLLAMASPTHAVPADLYYTGWAGQSQNALNYRAGWSGTTDGDQYGNGHTYYGIKLDVGVGTAGLFSSPIIRRSASTRTVCTTVTHPLTSTTTAISRSSIAHTRLLIPSTSRVMARTPGG